MASPSAPPPVKLICGMLSARGELLDLARGELAAHFGPVDIVSEIMDFDFTHYYDRQMGSPLLRQFVSFAELVPPEALAQAKHATNAMETAIAARGVAGILPSLVHGHAGDSAGETPATPRATPRPINLDPGYVDSPKLVLASMKNFAHRVYLGQGVYAEVTLLHRRGRWTPLDWTFPDYASGRYWPFLDQVRRRLREQLASGQVPAGGRGGAPLPTPQRPEKHA